MAYAQLRGEVRKTHGPYTGKDIKFKKGKKTSTAVQIDHVVALSDAWQKGAQKLSEERRTALRTIRTICWPCRGVPTRRSPMAMRPRGCRPTRGSVANTWRVRSA